MMHQYRWILVEVIESWFDFKSIESGMEYTYLNNTRAILITEMEKKDHQEFLDLFVEERIEVESWKKIFSGV